MYFTGVWYINLLDFQHGVGERNPDYSSFSPFKFLHIFVLFWLFSSTVSGIIVFLFPYSGSVSGWVSPQDRCSKYWRTAHTLQTTPGAPFSSLNPSRHWLLPAFNVCGRDKSHFWRICFDYSTKITHQKIPFCTKSTVMPWRVAGLSFLSSFHLKKFQRNFLSLQNCS